MNPLLEQEFDGIPNPFLVVCEGYGDAQFICALLKHKKIANCSVGCPSSKGGHGNGISAIGKYLASVRAVMQLGKANLSGLLVVVDSDLSSADCFKLICKALEKAGFPFPLNTFSIEGDPIKVGVFIIPGRGKPGTLEHLLWEAVIGINPNLERCVQTFCECAGGRINSASENQKAKMKMSSTIAAHCCGNPWASVGLVWKENDNPIPIDSKVFEEVADFLVQFTA